MSGWPCCCAGPARLHQPIDVGGYKWGSGVRRERGWITWSLINTQQCTSPVFRHSPTSLEHAHLTSFKSCFNEICGGLFTSIANSTFDFADMLRGSAWCGAQGVNDSPHLSVLQQRLQSKQVEWLAKFRIFLKRQVQKWGGYLQRN